MSTAVMRMTRTPPTTATTITSKLLLPPVTAVEEDGVSTQGHKGTQSSHSPHTSHTFREASGDRRYPTTLYPILDTHTMPHALSLTQCMLCSYTCRHQRMVCYFKHTSNRNVTHKTHTHQILTRHTFPHCTHRHTHTCYSAREHDVIMRHSLLKTFIQ